VTRTEADGRVVVEHQLYDQRTGAWQTARDGRTAAFDGSNTSSLINEAGYGYVRVGTTPFLGSAADLPYGIRAWIGVEAGQERMGAVDLRGQYHNGELVRVEATLSATGQPLFAASIDEARTADAATFTLLPPEDSPVVQRDEEVPVGRPAATGIGAFWFGPRLDGRDALTSVTVNRRGAAEVIKSDPGFDVDAHTVFYATGDQVSAYPVPSDTSPQAIDEVQVHSQPVSSVHARQFLAELDGENESSPHKPWRRVHARTADGSTALVVEHLWEGPGTGLTFVVDDTIVSVNGSYSLEDAQRLAALLQRL